MNELFHYGVKGMRWGVRKDTYNVRQSKQEYKEAKKNYKKVKKKLSRTAYERPFGMNYTKNQEWSNDMKKDLKSQDEAFQLLKIKRKQYETNRRKAKQHNRNAFNTFNKKVDAAEQRHDNSIEKFLLSNYGTTSYSKAVKHNKKDKKYIDRTLENYWDAHVSEVKEYEKEYEANKVITR